MSKANLTLGLAVGAFGLLIVLGRPQAEEEPVEVDEVEVSAPSDGLARARRNSLEMAVLSAVGNADCGFTEIGYGFRSPDDEAERLVDLMNSASAPAPPDGITYVLGRPRQPWQVAVRPDSAANLIAIEGYGAEVDRPVVSERVSC